jgi:hypothetical protein
MVGKLVLPDKKKGKWRNSSFVLSCSFFYPQSSTYSVFSDFYKETKGFGSSRIVKAGL